MSRVITDYLENTAAKYPDKIAYVDDKREITFAALRNEALHIAMQIIKLGYFKQPVAIYLEKGIGCISAFQAVSYSGNFYTMLDVEMPASRITKILATLMPKVIITDAEHISEIQEWNCDANVVIVENALEQDVCEKTVLDVTAHVTESDVLYVLFTSGSTGVPKGVITSHRAVISYLDAATEAYNLDDNTVIANQAPFYFVLSIIDIYCTIRNGGTTYIVPVEYFSFPGKLLRYIAENRVTLLNWVSSALSIVANLRAFNKVDISCVKTVIFGGEVMPIKHLNAWMDALPNTVFINGYGSTEVTDSATYYVVNRRFNETDLLPLGNPLKNTSVIVLNEKDELASKDEIGELCVRGNNLAYGYYNDMERTEKVFVQNPLNSSYAERIYKTGDLVRFNAYGEIEYIGRKDFQIKHMGNRIELGEIEVNISAVEGVNENCCLYDNDKRRIVVFYTGTLLPEELKEKLKGLLPLYMVPGICVRKDSLPRNLNGKFDREALKQHLKD